MREGKQKKRGRERDRKERERGEKEVERERDYGGVSECWKHTKTEREEYRQIEGDR